MSKEQRKRKKARTASPADRQADAASAQRRSGKRRRRRGNNILWYLLILVFMVTTTIVLTTTVFFKIEQITVTGSEHYNDRSLILSSGILLEENMFRLNDGEIKKKLIEEYSYIAQVRSHRRLPDTIVLEIKEAQPIGAIDAGAGYTLISEEGRVLECNTPVLPEGIPVVMGFSEETPAEGSYLEQTDSENVQRLSVLLNAIEETGFPYFDVIDLSDPYNLKLYYGDLFEIVLGTQANLEYKMELVQEVIETQDLVNTFRGTIDASYDGEVWTRPSGSVSVPGTQQPESGQEDGSDAAQSSSSSSDGLEETSQTEEETAQPEQEE